MSGILWECGATYGSGASTALVARCFGVRYGGAKRGSTALNARTRVRAKKKYGNFSCRNQSAPRAALSIWAFIPIHVDLPISSFPFFLLLLSQAVTDKL